MDFGYILDVFEFVWIEYKGVLVDCEWCCNE